MRRSIIATLLVWVLVASAQQNPNTRATAQQNAAAAPKGSTTFSSTVQLVVVDLNARSNPLDAIERVRASAGHIPLLGFLSHVQVDLAEKARAAGCDDVMPRSKFTRDLATILGQVKSERS